MVHVWVASKTVWSHCYIRTVFERFRDKGFIIHVKRYINSFVYFTLLYWTNNTTDDDDNDDDDNMIIQTNLFSGSVSIYTNQA